MTDPLDDIVITITTEEQDALRALLHETPPLLDEQSLGDTDLTPLALSARSMPSRIARRLIDFRTHGNVYGTLLFRGLPTDALLPATPADGKPARDKPTRISELNLLLHMFVLGEPIAYSDEKDGALVQNICPVQGRERRQENSGSVFLEFHTENGFHPCKPDYVALFCLRADHERLAQTATASSHRALQALPAEMMHQLRQPEYRIRVASSFGDSGPPRFSACMPVLSGSLSAPDVTIDAHAMDPMTPAAASALAAFLDELVRVAVRWVLVPGDLLIVDNRVAAHARTAFVPRYDGADRWLQRIFAVRDFRATRWARPGRSRVCQPLTVLTGESSA